MERAVNSSWSVGWLILVLLFVGSPQLFGQSDARHKNGHKPGSGPKHEPDCNIDGFHTEVTSAENTDEGCIKYKLKVSTDGSCRYDLSHFTVDIPCGTIQYITNSRNWKQEIGKDPTTGLTGFKIDDIPTFGKTPGDNFTIEFVLCRDASCSEYPSVVAYKAGQCVKYDTLNFDNGNNGGGDDGGSGGTCSTLLASLQVTSVTCSGFADGKLDIAIEAGNEPFTYAWSTGATTSSIQNLVAGVYAVTIVDADGNTLTLTKEVTQPNPLVLVEAITQPSCGTSGNGAINLSVSGGTGNYTFAWSNGATSEDLIGLNAGSYTVAVTDEAGCSTQKEFTLVGTTQINLIAIPSNTACGQTTGAINLTVSGGAAPYTYLWSNGATTEDIQNVGTGTYRSVVTDANGCQVIGTYFVQESTSLRITFTTVKSNCSNEATGSIDITVTGGVAPYTYNWQHGPTTEDVDGLVSGIYRVTVTDNAGCSALATILVQKQTLQVTAQVTQPLCADGTTGSVVLSPVNGQAPYTYEWSNGDTDNQLTEVSIGTYTVTVTDASGCGVTLSYTLTAPSAISATAIVENTNCGNDGSYTIDLTVAGGRFPYQYEWSDGQTIEDPVALSSGSYVVQITDANGCTVSQEVVINPDSFQWTCLIDAPTVVPVCNSVGNSLAASISDATTYAWSVASSDNSWMITSGLNTSAVIYTAGNSGSTATFTLVIEKDGCTKTCSYEMSGDCTIRDNNGGGDPNSGDPCAGEVVVNNPPDDPTEETDPVSEEEETHLKVACYPNPFEHRLNFDWKAEHDDYVRLEVYDQCGKLMKEVYAGSVRKGQNYHAEWDGGTRSQMYIYRFSSSQKQTHGKVFKK